jgi:multicomponent Na+:H+ antiporter subunit G
MDILMLIGAIIVLTGSLFLFLASLGLVRMPDLYSRMQAGTKATTLGTILVVLGLAFIVPAVWSKLLLLGVFVFLTNPVSSHALSRSAHFQGVNPLDVKVPGRTMTGHDAFAAAKKAGDVPSPTAPSSRSAEGGAPGQKGVDG